MLKYKEIVVLFMLFIMKIEHKSLLELADFSLESFVGFNGDVLAQSVEFMGAFFVLI